MAEFDKNIKNSPGLRGHFALGTLSKTYLKDAVFEIHVFIKKKLKQLQNQKMSNLTPTSKTLSELDIVLSELTHFDT